MTINVKIIRGEKDPFYRSTPTKQTLGTNLEGHDLLVFGTICIVDHSRVHLHSDDFSSGDKDYSQDYPSYAFICFSTRRLWSYSEIGSNFEGKVTQCFLPLLLISWDFRQKVRTILIGSGLSSFSGRHFYLKYLYND